ncbi:hypothetical protein WJX77_009235 [Trebouxia sp. C0004]
MTLSHIGLQKTCEYDFSQDLSQLSRDAVRPYMLPWDVRKLLKCLNGLLSPKPACYGYQEPSQFCTARGVVHPLPEDA